LSGSKTEPRRRRRARLIGLGGLAGSVVVAALLSATIAAPGGRTPVRGEGHRPRANPAPGAARVLSESLPSGVSLQAIDGGDDFYTDHGYTDAAPLDDPTFFPIGVWYPSLNGSSDVSTYRELGINMLDRPDGSCDLGLLDGTGIYAIPQFGECGGPNGKDIGSESVGLFTDDEVDMNYGPGAGYSYLQSLIADVPGDIRQGRFFWSNYGTGVLTEESTAQAAQFVNDYQQTVSDDLYWFTDRSATGVCAAFYGLSRCTAREAQRGSNYGSMISYLRSLEDPPGSEPIWAFVENGSPFTDDDRAITPAQMNWAVWSSIIHGARGIIYFNHSFGGRAQGDNNFENGHYVTTGIVAQAKATDALITSLAPVLNDATALGLVTASPAATTFGGIETMSKYHDGTFYVFADTRDPSKGVASRRIKAVFHLDDPGATSVSVLGENRILPVVDGAFTDVFATAATVHIYQVNG